MSIFGFLKNKKQAAKPAAGAAPKTAVKVTVTSTKQVETVLAVSDGVIKPLSSLNDGVFSQKMLGDGMVVAPVASAKKLEYYAPVSGELTTVFHTKHAYGLKTASGLEILVHIGLDTVNLKGAGFESLVKQGDMIKAGDRLAVVDVEYLRKNVPSPDAIVIVTSGHKIEKTAPEGPVSAKSMLYTVSMAN